METHIAYSNVTETVQNPHAKRFSKTKAAMQTKVPKTPESELMSVEEYFGMVWNRCLEKYEKLHG